MAKRERRGSLLPVLARSGQPIERVDSRKSQAGTVVVVIGASAGAAATLAELTGVSFVPTFIASILLLVLLLVLRAAVLIQRDLNDALAAPPEPRPFVEIGDPYVDEHFGVSDSEGGWVGYGNLLKIPVRNDPPDDLPTTDARHVYARVEVLSLGWETLQPESALQWHESGSIEQTLPPNGRPVDAAVVLQFPGTGTWVWNDKSKATLNSVFGKRLDDRYSVGATEFTVAVTVRGTGFSPVKRVFRVESHFPALLIRSFDVPTLKERLER